MCTNRRLGTPRQLRVPDEELFAGELRRGIGGDVVDVPWLDKRVVLLGHGPFATENMRSALEHHVKHLSFLCRRHGLVCPEVVDYVNYIRPYDDEFKHPASGSAVTVGVWRQVYGISGAAPPEVWATGGFAGRHTVSVSDMYFVAHFGRRRLVGGQRRPLRARRALRHARQLDAGGRRGHVGFEVNEGNWRSAVRTSVAAG